MRPVIGWTVGAGVEYRLTGHSSLKAEYLFAIFSKLSVQSTNLQASSNPSVPFPTSVFTRSATLEGHLIRVGFNYSFYIDVTFGRRRTAPFERLPAL